MNPTYCPICSSRHAEYLTEENGYPLYQCKGCHTVFVYPMPKGDPLNKFYGKLSAKLSGEQYELFARKAHRAACDYISQKYPVGKALDVGCGHGSFLRQLIDKGWEAVGLDIELPETDLSANAIRGRIEHAPFMDESFDLITLWWVLEHSTDPVTVMKQVRRMIKQGGSVLLRVPYLPFIKFASRFKFMEKLDSEGFKNPVSEKESVFSLLGPPHHLFGFSATSIETIVKSAGFKGYEVLFLDQILTGNARRDMLDNWLYLLAKNIYPLFKIYPYHDIVILVEG